MNTMRPRRVCVAVFLLVTTCSNSVWSVTFVLSKLISTVVERSSAWGARIDLPPSVVRAVREQLDEYGGVTLESYASERLDEVLESALSKHCEGDFAQAAKLYKEALELASHKHPEDNVDVLAMECHFATVLVKQRKYRAAEPVLHKTLAKQRRLLGRHHPLLLSTKAKLADAYHGQSKFSQAKAAYSEALFGLLDLVGATHPSCEALKAKLRAVKKEEQREGRRLRQQIESRMYHWRWTYHF